MGYRNLTITGKTDGFGCQLNAKFSGIAFCIRHKKYRYIHTPFSTVSHGYRDQNLVDKLNDLINIPDGRVGKKIHCRYPYMKQVFASPNNWYNNEVFCYLRSRYWENKNYETKENIAIHIRRGDIARNKKNRKVAVRYQSNKYYNTTIPRIVEKFSDSMPIVIYSEGDLKDFESISNGWPKCLSERLVFNLGVDWRSDCEYDLIKTFHDLVSSRVLVQARSGLSYTAGILNENCVMFEGGMAGRRSIGQKVCLDNWIPFY